MSTLDYQLYYQRTLPHYQPPGATLFITFRLAGSLPKEVIQHLEVEKHREELEIDRISGQKARENAAYQAQKRLFAKWDAELDAAENSPHWLAEPGIANIVCAAMHHMDNQVYTLDAYCVMPNHVHMVFTPLVKDETVHPLSKILHSLKGFTARKANILLGRRGDFWQHESYDHVVRNSAELARIVEYVRMNPIRVGLPAKWVYFRTKM
jgi:putative transposase